MTTQIALTISDQESFFAGFSECSQHLHFKCHISPPLTPARGAVRGVAAAGRSDRPCGALRCPRDAAFRGLMSLSPSDLDQDRDIPSYPPEPLPPPPSAPLYLLEVFPGLPPRVLSRVPLGGIADSVRIGGGRLDRAREAYLRCLRDGASRGLILLSPSVLDQDRGIPSGNPPEPLSFPHSWGTSGATPQSNLLRYLSGGTPRGSLSLHPPRCGAVRGVGRGAAAGRLDRTPGAYLRCLRDAASRGLMPLSLYVLDQAPRSICRADMGVLPSGTRFPYFLGISDLVYLGSKSTPNSTNWVPNVPNPPLEKLVKL